MPAPQSAAIRDAIQRQSPGGVTLPLPSPLLGALPPQLQGLPMYLFWMNFPTFANIAINGGTQQQSFNVNPNYYFAGWFGMASIRSADDQTDESTIPLLASMTDNNNFNYQPLNTPTDIRNFVSILGVSNPAVWAQPLIVPPKGSVTVQLQNLSTATAVNVRLCIQGVLIQATT